MVEVAVAVAGMDVETHATEVDMECLLDPENMLFFVFLSNSFDLQQMLLSISPGSSLP